MFCKYCGTPTQGAMWCSASCHAAEDGWDGADYGTDDDDVELPTCDNQYDDDEV